LRRRKKRDLLALALAGTGEWPTVSDRICIDLISLIRHLKRPKDRKSRKTRQER
jgi:hypothetical protein